MTTLRFSNGMFRVSGAPAALSPRLIGLGWRRAPHAIDAWGTASPYLAAPLWDLRDITDDTTTAALSAYAWHYQTSFARSPLTGVGVDALRLPAGELFYPFQVAGAQRALLRNKIMNCDEPGCGKSPQSLVLVNHLRPARTLIGCPTFLADNWAVECERWLVDAQPITILDGAKKRLPDQGIIILPYSRAHAFERQIAAGPPIDLLIGDEFHALKDATARRSVPFTRTGGLIERAKRVVLLSGTPMPNNPLELYAPLRALAPDFMADMSAARFQQTYCNTVEMPIKRGGREFKVQKIVGKGHEALNAELRASGIMVRRLKNDVLDQLPPKNVYFIHMRPDAAVEELVREESDLYEQLQTRILTAQELITLKGHISNVRCRLGVLKAPSIAMYCKWLIESGEDRLVLFMLHLDAIEAVRRSFEGTDVLVHILTGSEKPAERFNRVKDFQKPGGGKKLIIGQVQAAGEGLTMTSSRYAVLGEISWTPGKNDQCIDRIHRISQTRQVDAPICCYPHSVEERVIRVNARKAIDAREVLDYNLQQLFREAAE